MLLQIRGLVLLIRVMLLRMRQAMPILPITL